MKKIIILTLIWLLLGIVIHAQNLPAAKNAGASVTGGTSINNTPESNPDVLTGAALAAQGGEKFKNLESMALSGTVNIYLANSPQSISGKFLWVTAGERMRIEVNAQPLVFKQIFDGQRSYSSIPGLQMGTPKSS